MKLKNAFARRAGNLTQYFRSSRLNNPAPPPPPVICRNNPRLLDFRFAFPLKFILIALVFLLLSAPPVSSQTTFSVSSDGTTGSSCTLRHAINAANNDAVSGGCAAGSGADIINITADITLTDHLPSITTDITFNGVGGNRTLNGSDSYRAFNINTAGISVTLNNLTLAENRAPVNSTGGAINFPGGDGTANLTLNNVTIRDSESWYTGSQRNGGGLYCNSSTLRITNSRFYNNRGNEAGALDIGSSCDATVTGSAFYNNRARLLGGAIVISKGAKATISNSSIYGNITGSTAGDGRGSAIYIIGGSGSSHRDIYLNHLTITGNQNSETNDKRASQAAVQIVLSNAKVHLRNSIIYGNNTDATTPGVDCSRTSATQTLLTDSASELESNVGNIIGDGNCGTPTGVFGSGGNPQLPASATSGYFALSQSSPAVDGAACISGLNQDQRGRPRPSPAGGRCDIGAYEYQYPPPPPSSDDGDGSGSGDGDGEGSVDGFEYSAPPPSTCLTLEGIAAYNLSESTQCQRVDAVGIANPAIQEGDFVDAVDVWSWVMPDTRVCFEAAGSAFKFIDTATMPRTVQDLPACSWNGMTCGAIDGIGMLVLLPGEAPSACAAPVAQATPIPARSLSGCMVRTKYMLNLRDAPAGAKIGGVPYDVTLTALARTVGWFKVDNMGQQGWIAAMYVEPIGDCD